MAGVFQVHITDSDYPDIAIETAVLAPVGGIVYRHHLKTAEEAIAACQDADALLVGWFRTTRQVMEGLPRLKAVARYGVGFDHIDIEAATELGIAVCNAPTYCTEEVATHALSLLLALARGLGPSQESLQGGRWLYAGINAPMPRLSEKILGIVGLGRIGSRMARFCRPLFRTIIACDPYIEPGEIPLVSLDELLQTSDFVSLHCPLTHETRDLLDERAFGLMKPTAYLINTARGGIVSSPALDRALRSGAIAGAGLDVLPVEPPDPADPLLSAPNLIITPHAAWYSASSPADLRRETAMGLAELFNRQRPVGLQNPEALGSERWARWWGA